MIEISRERLKKIINDAIIGENEFCDQCIVTDCKNCAVELCDKAMDRWIDGMEENNEK